MPPSWPGSSWLPRRSHTPSVTAEADARGAVSSTAPPGSSSRRGGVSFR